ncbi:MAG: arginine--tRNA ligase [Nitrososphaeria archaeon]
MTFEAFQKETEKDIMKALNVAGYALDHIPLAEPPRPELGDLSTTVAFEISKKTNKKPLDIANELCSTINKLRKELVYEASVAPPGYINFKMNRTKFATITLRQLIRGKLKGIDIGKGKRVIVEHTSVNPNKALHIGHLRNVVIGDVIQRLLKYTNHEVVVLNYIDDSGLQVADIIVGFKYLGFPEQPTTLDIKFDQYCGDQVYVKVNQIYTEKPETQQYRRVVLKEMENQSSETYRYAKAITERVLLDQLKTCARIGAFYDCLNFESHIMASGIWQKVLQMMKEKNLVVYEEQGKNAGCWVIKSSDEQDKVLIRSDGTTTYIAKDIPYAAWKLGLVEDFFNYDKFITQANGKTLWRTTLSEGIKQHPTFNNADVAINVIDVRQSWLQKIISNLLKKFGGGAEKKSYIHLGYEIVSLSRETASQLGIKVEDQDFVHMSGRAGIYINADDVIDRLKKLAYQETRERNPGAEEKWLDAISTSLAISAIRFSLIKHDIGKILVFDLNEALKLEGETGPYLQYTFARASRILEKHGKEIIEAESVDKLTEPEEYALIKELSKIDSVLKEAVNNLAPNKLAEYAYTICLLFNTFYEKHQVLREPDEAKKAQRLMMVTAFANTLKVLMDVLGVEAHGRI